MRESVKMEFKNMKVELSNNELNFLIDSIGSKIGLLKDNEQHNKSLIQEYRGLRNKLTEVIKEQIQGVSQ